PWDVGDEFSFCIGVTRSGQWHDVGSRLRVSSVAGAGPAYVMEDRTWARLLTFERQGLLGGSRLAPVYMADEADLPAQNRLDLRFSNAADAIDLLAYELKEAAGPNGEPALTLYWRAAEPVSRDYSVFVHVRDPE